MSEDQKRLLEKQLWAVANVLRGKMNADEYKNYILGFIFYKYLSEKLTKYADEKLLAKDKVNFEEIDENSKKGKEYIKHIESACLSHLGYFLRPNELFSFLVKKGKGQINGKETFILQDLKNVLNNIEQTSMGTDSEDDFKGLFDDVDLTSSKLGSSENKKNEVIVEVLVQLNGIDFKLEDTKSDLLGDAYEYLIGEFAAGAGKKGGEFYTPAQVSRLMAKIVSDGKKRVRSVYDPTCGSGSLLLRIRDYADVSEYYGQELNPTTYNLARMNMILHGVNFENFKIKQGDTLAEDMHPDLKAEAIIANPPFSANWKGEDDPQLVHDDRFSQYGRLAPKSAADYAFITHMLYHLSDNGTMAIVLPHGVLYRGGAEEVMRKYIIEKQNYLDAIISLPSNLFYGTTYATVILVFKKCRKKDDNILFVNASKEFGKSKNQNTLTDDNIEKIFETYISRKEVVDYAHLATLSEIKNNDFNLNIPRYLNIFEEDIPINLDETANQLSALYLKEQEITSKFLKICEELSIQNPFSPDTLNKVFNKEIKFRDQKGIHYPDWIEKNFDDLFDFLPTNSFSRDQLNYTDGSVSNIHYGDIHTKFKSSFKASDYALPFVNNDVELKDENNIIYLQTGDLVIADASEDYADIGKSIEVINTDNLKILAGLHTILARPKTKELVIGFMSVYTRSNQYKSQIRKVAQGTKVLGIPKKYLKKIKIKIPSIEEQTKIINFFSSVDNSLDELIQVKKDQVQLTKQWEKGLMQKLFV